MVLLTSIVSSSIIPGLKTVIIPKLPLPFRLMLFLLSAFIKTLPYLLTSCFIFPVWLSIVRPLIDILPFDKARQLGSQ